MGSKQEIQYREMIDRIDPKRPTITIRFNGIKYTETDEWPIPDEMFRAIDLTGGRVMVVVGIKMPEVDSEQLVDRYMGCCNHYANEQDREDQIANAKSWICRKLTQSLIEGVVNLNGNLYPIEYMRLKEMTFFITSHQYDENGKMIQNISGACTESSGEDQSQADLLPTN